MPKADIGLFLRNAAHLARLPFPRRTTKLILHLDHSMQAHQVAPAANSGAKQRSDHRGSCFEGRKLATLIVNAVPSGEYWNKKNRVASKMKREPH